MRQPWVYEIQVQGRIGERWAHWFDDMQVSIEPGAEPETTKLTGAMVDQAALLGVLHKLYTLGLPLLSVRREEGDGMNGEREA
ncbi:MAG: hypothetical protein JXA93_19270 [Anaerolineae bacterium]|nr:hypothetical protein [Anaerolineae bacterium]